MAIRNLADNSIQKTFDVAVSTFVKWTTDGKGLLYNISDVWREGGSIWLQPIDGTPPRLYLMQNLKKFTPQIFHRTEKNFSICAACQLQACAD